MRWARSIPKRGGNCGVRYEGYSVIPRPVFAAGLLFIGTGYDSPTVMAIRPGGTGDVTETNVAWTVKKGAPNTPSLLVVDELLYMVSDRGVATCLNAKTGQEVWQERIGGNYSASPLYADGKVYFQSEEGDTTVVRRNDVRGGRQEQFGRADAGFVRRDGATLLIRGESNLYRIEQP